MERRTFIGVIAGGFLAAPITAEAEQANKLPHIGYLLARTTTVFVKSASDGLRDLGYIEGKNIITEQRTAEGRPARYPEVAAELVRLNLDVIVADGAAATAALRRITRTMPIVMVAADPVEAGFVTSLAKPGGNITGLSTNSPRLMGKRLELLREAFPHVSRVAVIGNPLNPAYTFFVAEAESAGRSLGLHMAPAPIRSPDDVDSLFGAVEHNRANALLISEDPTVVAATISQIAQRALARRLPTVGGTATFAKAGILLTYGPDFAAIFRRTALYVDKILKGAKPADLPVEEPTKFELIINLKTAKALGLTIPPSLLLRADQIIE